MKKLKRRHDKQLATVSAGQPALTTRQVGALLIDDVRGAISVDSTRVEGPEKAYDADLAWVEHRTGSVSLFFAKVNRDEPNSLLSRLEIRYPPEDLLITLWGNSQSFIEGVSRYVAEWPQEVLTLSGDQNAAAKQSHSEWATFTYMSHSGSDSAIDFYHLSPSGLARYARNREVGGLKLRPVVRIQLSTFALHLFLQKLSETVEAVRAYIPERHLKSAPADAKDDEVVDGGVAEGEQREYGS